MEYTQEQKAWREAGFKAIDLSAYYDACNRRYFNGELPDSGVVKVRWVTHKDKGYEFMPEGAHYDPIEKRINIRLSAHVTGGYELLQTMVHEMVHAYTWLVKGEFMDVKHLKNGKEKIVHHGEAFGAKAREVNKVAGFRLMQPQETNYGLSKSHPERMHYSIAPDKWGMWIDHETHLAEVAAENERQAAWDARWEIWNEWNDLVEDEMNQKVREGDMVDGEWVSAAYYDDVWFEHAHGMTYELWEKEEQRRAHEAMVSQHRVSKAAAKAAKAAAFKKRIESRPLEKKIETLRKQLANSRTPQGFIPGIKAKLAALEEEFDK